MKFPTKNNGMAVSSDVPGNVDQYQNGVRLDAVKVALFTSLSGSGNVYSNGLPLDPNGAVVTVDCAGSLPVDVKWCNGIPISAGAVCVSNEASSYWSNGIAFTSYGAISVVSA